MFLAALPALALIALALSRIPLALGVRILVALCPLITLAWLYRMSLLIALALLVGSALLVRTITRLLLGITLATLGLLALPILVTLLLVSLFLILVHGSLPSFSWRSQKSAAE